MELLYSLVSCFLEVSRNGGRDGTALGTTGGRCMWGLGEGKGWGVALLPPQISRLGGVRWVGLCAVEC